MLQSRDMPICRVQVRIPAASNVSEDMVMNTWHFFCDAADEGTRASVDAALVAFYEQLDGQKSNLMNWTAARVRWFDMSDPEPRYPIDDNPLALTSATGTPTARELAICVSFHGEFVSGSNPSRRRGRIYFGPIAASAVGTDGRLASGAQTAAVTAASGLLATSNLASGWSWGVYSPSSSAFYEAEGGWVDNELDVQRRRGTKYSSRTTF